MLGDFLYYNPTKLYFGENALDFLLDELENYGDNVLLIYGTGSIKANGIYDKVIKILKDAGKNIFEDSGVMPNPTVDKLYDGCEKARSCKADLLLAVGGGSVCDYAKAVAACAYFKGDPWEKLFKKGEAVGDSKILPVGSVLTMVGTGSEMNGGSGISNPKEKLKLAYGFDQRVYPKFAILNPVFTYTLPKYQMVAGIFDIMSHILEQYFSGDDDNTSDYIMEGLLKSLIHSARIAVKKPTDYEARSNIMWISTWALNNLVAKGKATDWMVHMIGHTISAHTDATHGMTLSAISLSYYRLILPYGLNKFKRFATEVWGVKAKGKTDTEIALEGLLCMESFMKELGVVLSLKELGVTEDMLDSMVKTCDIKTGGYKALSKKEIKRVLRESL